MMRKHLKVNSSFSLFFQAIFRVQILVAAVLLSFIGIPVFCKVSPLSFLNGHQLVGVTVHNWASQSQSTALQSSQLVVTSLQQRCSHKRNQDFREYPFPPSSFSTTVTPYQLYCRVENTTFIAVLLLNH